MSTSSWQTRSGSLLLSVTHPTDAVAGAPVLCIREPDGDRALLRLECDESAPRIRIDPDDRNESLAIAGRLDPVGAAIEALARDAQLLLEKAGLPEARRAALDVDDLQAALREAEAALRNPPVDLDAIDLSLLEQRISEKWNTYHEPDLIAAWVAEMDYPLAAPIRRVLGRAADTGDVGYPIAVRDTGLAECFAERMQTRFGWNAAPERVAILSEVVQGMYVALAAYSEPGDGVVVQTPIYPPFLHSVRNTGRKLIENRLAPGDRRWEIDFDALRRDADAGTRVLMLCNPHNPTGRVFARDELERLAELVLERDLVVVSDEIHGDVVFAGRAHLPFATLGEEIAARTVTLTSATKAFNIPGLRCAVAHFGSESLQRRFDAAASPHVRGGLGLLGIYATIAAWRHSDPWLDQVREHLQANRDFVGRFLAERCPDVRFHAPEATYLAWLDCGALALPASPGRFFFERGRIALSDGYHFGAGFEPFVRINFATSRPILTQILERFAGALESL